MKKVLFILGFIALATGFSSCDCNCYQDPTNQYTVCKQDYEAAWGAGTWAQGASEYRAAGWKCK